MFEKHKYEDRLLVWADFRQHIETSDNPIQDTIDFFEQSPTVSIATDPYNQSTWPSPWELIEENQYCSFLKLLGICYTLQLTERFNQSQIVIYIATDVENSSTLYYLELNNFVLGYNNGEVFINDSFPRSLVNQKKYAMPRLQ